MTTEFFLTHSLEKVFPDTRPYFTTEKQTMSVLTGEIPSFQLVYRCMFGDSPHFPRPQYSVEFANAPCRPRLRAVELMPSDFTSYPVIDNDYLRTGPALFPDLLKPLTGDTLELIPDQYRAVWIDFPETAAIAPGLYPVDITLKERGGSNSFTLHADIRVVDTGLDRPARPVHTEWFYADCLADYYQTPVWSEEHWEITERFIRCAAREHAVNMLLTPVFSPALDTARNHYRTTVQLTDISLSEGVYSFNFDKLKRWCGICRKHGIRYIEIPPFFTQWGAEATPGITANTAEGEKRVFGWHVPANSPDYRRFLDAFIPALKDALASFGYGTESVFFHISDEPSPENSTKYEQARNIISDLTKGCPTIDAVSNFDFYEKGLIRRPVVANDHIQPFIDFGVPDLWMYYCCAQSKDVPNRFFAMPSTRNRVIGVLMYIHRIKGFLHWGYNFYNTRFSLAKINPFITTHAGYAFPSGDPFLVYPGDGGHPLSSIRGEVLRSAFEDIDALYCLESRVGRQRVEEIIYEDAAFPMTFNNYPKSASYLLNLREKINRAIERNA